MKNLIVPILDYIVTFPLYLWVSAFLVLLLLIIVPAALIKRARLIKSALKKIDMGLTDPLITAKLLSRPGLVETLLRKKGDVVISHFGVADHLLRRLEHRKRSEDVKRLLKLAPEEGMFPIFFLALQKDSIAQIFHSWLKDNHEILLIRRMALSAKGRNFNTEKAIILLSDCIEELRELSGDPEWPVRYFSLRILLLDDDSKSKRLVRESFSDPHPLLRRTVAEKIGEENL
ncbi:MAG: hypothetical protein KAH21_00890, partial [Spirochaetaceae bacterium]|nr:hypothetical protein [Spirochaetaceae bacterium]